MLSMPALRLASCNSGVSCRRMGDASLESSAKTNGHVHLLRIISVQMVVKRSYQKFPSLCYPKVRRTIFQDGQTKSVRANCE